MSRNGNGQKKESAALTVIKERAKGLRGFLEREDMMEQLSRAAVDSIDVPRLVRTAMGLATRQPTLLECTPESWYVALQESAEVGIMPTGSLARAYLISRWNRNIKDKEVHFQLGYRGLAELARRSPDIRNVTAELVHEGDEFSIEKGDQPRLLHVPDPDAADGRPIRGAYAIAWWVDGFVQYEWMTWGQILEIARQSDSWGDGEKPKPTSPWASHQGEMGRKTVIRRLAKHLPLEVDVERMVAYDDAVEFPQFAGGRRRVRAQEDVEAVGLLNQAIGAEPAEAEAEEADAEVVA